MTTKVITLLGLVLLIGACNMNSPQMIEQQIKKKKGQVEKINDEITLLESSLPSDSTSDEIPCACLHQGIAAGSL